MSYKIVGDSSCEYTESLRNDPCFVRVPLGLEVGDYRIMDDETFNQAEFLAQVAASPVCPKSSCPSPERFMNAYDCDADMVFSSAAVTTVPFLELNSLKKKTKKRIY